MAVISIHKSGVVLAVTISLIFAYSFAEAAGSEEPEAGQITYVEGTAREKTSGSEGWVTLEKGMTVEKGDSVTTLEKSRLILDFDRNGTFRIGPTTMVFVTDLAGGQYYFPELISGDIWAVLSKENGKNQQGTFRIILPTAEISTDSAIARFEAGDDCTTEIRVYEGDLEITRRQDYESIENSADTTIRANPCAPDSSLPDSLTNWQFSLGPGERLLLSSNGAVILRGTFSSGDIDEDTDWVKWNKDRDKDKQFSK